MTKTKTKKVTHSGKALNYGSALYQYLKDINQIPLLSKAEEIKYARLAAQGNKLAKDKLINANLRFVVSVSKKYQGKGLALEDLISEGNLGLMNAIDHFDVERGYRLISYAVWWIRQAIVRAIYEKGRLIRLPSNKIQELAQLDMDKNTALTLIAQDTLSLDEPLSQTDNTLTTKDLLEDEQSKSPSKQAINSVLRDELEEFLQTLETRSAEIIRYRFGLGDTGPLTLKEIGERYDMSRERVRQIEKCAMYQLRKSPRRKKLEAFVNG